MLKSFFFCDIIHLYLCIYARKKEEKNEKVW